MLKYLLSMCALVSMLQGCASVPNVQTLVVCPRLPDLEPVAVPQVSYIDQMQAWLSRSLPTPTDSASDSKPAIPLTKLPAP